MTHEELNVLLAKHDRTFGKPEDGLAKWRREAREQEERFAREREKSRNLTDSEMVRWREHFEGLVASERAAIDERIREEREFTRDVMAQVIAELRENIKADTQQALEGVRKPGEERLAEIRGVVDRQTALKTRGFQPLREPYPQLILTPAAQAQPCPPLATV